MDPPVSRWSLAEVVAEDPLRRMLGRLLGCAVVVASLGQGVASMTVYHMCALGQPRLAKDARRLTVGFSRVRAG